MITDEQCEAIAARSRRIAIVGPAPALLVSYEQAEGDPTWAGHVIYMHPADAHKLRQWGDAQELVEYGYRTV